MTTIEINEMVLHVMWDFFGPYCAPSVWQNASTKEVDLCVYMALFEVTGFPWRKLSSCRYIAGEDEK
jgi:hypothetical protein